MSKTVRVFMYFRYVYMCMYVCLSLVINKMYYVIVKIVNVSF